jgi:hypothetical protein
MFTMRNYEFNHARSVASTMMLKPVYDKFEIEMDIPAQTTVSTFLKRFNIVLSEASSVTAARSDAATVSNITHWFEDPYTEEFASQFTTNAIYNADEIHIDLSSDVKVAKEKGAARAPEETEEYLSNHISFMKTISPGPNSPLPFFIIGGLKHIPPELQQFIQ